jgi:hypothetical protein
LKIFESLGDTRDKFFAGTFGLAAVASASSGQVLALVKAEALP